MKRKAAGTNTTLDTLLNRGALRRLAGDRSFERGEDYFNGRRVRALAEHAGVVTAKALGTREYRVKLRTQDGDVAYSCTCPVGLDGAFCKHCVAVALAWRTRRGGPDDASGETAQPRTTMDDARVFLAGQSKDALIEMVIEQAMDDDLLRERLLMKAAKTGAKGIDFAVFRAAIDEAVDADGFVEYSSAYNYARRIDGVIDSVEELTKEGHATEAIDLIEHALRAVEEALGSVDDSDGNLGGVLERLQDLHRRACKKARPDPEALAKRLYAWALEGSHDTFLGAAGTYADVLGRKGLAVYRKLAEAEWARVPALTPGQEDPEKWGTRFRITYIMETLARQSGDIETLMDIKRRDLSYPYAYLEIAEIYKKARRHDLALEWAERGLKAFPRRTDSRPREFLAEEYHRRDRHDEAMAIIWAEFTESPSLHQYQELKKHADRIGQWPEWRERALALLREENATAQDGTRKASPIQSSHPDRSELVRVFLWERDIETAWREASKGGCSPDLWMTLAAKREDDHPEDALPIYLDHIEPTLAQKNNVAYAAGIRLLRKIRHLMARLGRKEEFSKYLESIRRAHKQKRNFVRLLDRAKWA